MKALIPLLLFVSALNAQEIEVKQRETDRGKTRITFTLPSVGKDTIVVMHKDTVFVVQQQPGVLTNDINSYLSYVGTGNNTDAVLRFDHTMPAVVGAPAAKTWMTIAPLEKGFGGVSYNLYSTMTKYRNDDQGDHVVSWGIGTTAGGSALVPGQPGVDFSLEQNYKPIPGSSLTEGHFRWITPWNEQIRVWSMTADNKTKNVDFFITADPFYVKSVAGNMYFRVWDGGLRLFNKNSEFWIGNTVMQSIDWGTGRALKILNAGIIAPALASQNGGWADLQIDPAGNVRPKP